MSQTLDARDPCAPNGKSSGANVAPELFFYMRTAIGMKYGFVAADTIRNVRNHFHFFCVCGV